MRIRLIAALMALALMVSMFAGCYTYEEIIEEVPVGGETSSKVTDTDDKDTSSEKATSSKATSSKKTTSSKKPTTATSSKKDVYSYPELAMRPVFPDGWVSDYVLMEKPSSSEDDTTDVDVDDATSRYDDYVGFGKYADQLINSLSDTVWNGDKIYDMIAGEKAPSGSATLWPYGGYMEACGAAYEYDPTNTLYETEYKKSLKNVMVYEATGVNDRWGAEPGTYLALTCWPGSATAEVFYDDDVWIAKEFLHAYKLGITNDGVKDVNYLTQATRMVKYICETGWEESWRGGGVLWMDPHYMGSGSSAPQKNTCINAPAADVAVDLYMVTGETAYLEHSKKIYAWVKGQLLDTDDFLMMDKLVNTEGNITLDAGKLPYNTGCMISAAVGLYEAEKAAGIADAEDYLNDALKLADAGIAKWIPRTQALDNVGELHWTNKISSAKPWFQSYLAEGLVDLYHLSQNDPDHADLASYTQPLRVALGLACSNRAYSDAGWFNNDLGALANAKDSDITVMEQSATARMLFMAGSIYDDEIYTAE